MTLSHTWHGQRMTWSPHTLFWLHSTCQWIGISSQSVQPLFQPGVLHNFHKVHSLWWDQPSLTIKVRPTMKLMIGWQVNFSHWRRRSRRHELRPVVSSSTTISPSFPRWCPKFTSTENPSMAHLHRDSLVSTELQTITDPVKLQYSTWNQASLGQPDWLSVIWLGWDWGEIYK